MKEILQNSLGVRWSFFKHDTKMAQTIGEKIENADNLKIKVSIGTRDIISKVKRQATIYAMILMCITKNIHIQNI